MNRNLVIFIILWLLSLAGISFYGGPVSYGLFFFLTVTPLISLIYILIVIIRFRIYQRLDAANLICGRDSDFYFTLQNEGPVGFFGVKVRFYSSFSTISGIDDGVEYELTPGTGIQKHTGLLCKYRGEYEVGIKQVMISDCFRLFTVSYKNREPLRVNVKPDLIMLNELKSAELALSTSREQLTNPTEPDILVREYVTGDDLRKVNWKATASAGKLMIRKTIGEEQQGIGLMIDSKRFSDSNFDYIPVESKMLETVLALTLFFTEKRTPITVYSMSGILSEDAVERGSRFDSFYEKMSAFAFSGSTDTGRMYSEILRQGTIFQKKAVFIVTHEFNEENRLMALELSSVSIPVIVCVVSDDPGSNDPDIRLPGMTLVKISTDSDITEVL
ncbi:MAG: DUF58 domain-containing protein [Lachnospiraceae bacterium]|nr:DUF58 domain-containing protein [Lachnospiraceae bacterium]